MKQNATVLTIETDFGKAFFFFAHLIQKKSLSCTVVLKRGPQYWQCSFLRSVVTFFEKKLVFALWLGKIIILLVTLLKPYAGSWISDSWGGGVAIFYILWGYLPLENYYKINQNMIDVQVRNLPPMRTTRKVRIIEIGSCWRFGPCRFSSYGMYLNIRTNHSLFYQEYISAQVIIPRPHPQHILFPTSWIFTVARIRMNDKVLSRVEEYLYNSTSIIGE